MSIRRGGRASASTFSRHTHSTTAMRHTPSVAPSANNMKDSAILCMTDEQVLELSTEEYNDVMTTIRNMMQHFIFENEFFERCIMKMKMDPDLEPAVPNSGFSVCFTIRLRRPSGFFATDRTVCLTGSQKCELARGELEEFTKDLAMMKNDCDAIISDFKVTLEDLHLTLVRIKKHHERLKRDVSPYLKDPSKKMEAHNAFLRFHQIVMDDLEAAAEKLKTANANCIALHRDMMRHIKEYEVSGNLIQVVDIHELRVRSQQALQEIQRLYLQSCWYKAVTARTTLTLERTRALLNSELKTAAEMERKLRQLTEASQNVQSELERYHIRYECEEYKTQQDREEAQQIKFPAVRDLINTHLELQQLTRQEKIEAKHLKIAKTKYEQHKRLWARVRRSS